MTAPKLDAFHPFADDAAVATIGGLSIENGTRVIGLHGSLDIGRDRAGLERARSLSAALSAIVAALEAESPPAAAAEAEAPTTSVANPFA